MKTRYQPSDGCFVKHNDTTKAKCIMADKDMVERDIIAERFQVLL